MNQDSPPVPQPEAIPVIDPGTFNMSDLIVFAINWVIGIAFVVLFVYSAFYLIEAFRHGHSWWEKLFYGLFLVAPLLIIAVIVQGGLFEIPIIVQAVYATFLAVITPAFFTYIYKKRFRKESKAWLKTIHLFGVIASYGGIIWFIARIVMTRLQA